MIESADGLPTEHVETAFEGMKRRSLHGGALTLVSQILKFIMKFGSTVVITHLLRPAEFGLIAMVSPILGFVSAFNDLGFGQAIVQREQIAEDQISALFWRNMALSCGLALLLCLISPAVGLVYHEPRTIRILIALAGLLVLSALSIVPGALLKRHMQYGSLVITELASILAGVVVTIGSAMAGSGYWSLVLGQLATSLTSVIGLFVFSRWHPSRVKRASGMGALTRFGAHLTVVNIATYFSITADNMIVGAVIGKVELGLYDRSYTLTVQPLNQLLAPLNQVSIPLLSRMQGSPALFKQTYLNMLRTALMFVVPAMLFASLLAKSVIPLLLGSRWVAAAPIFAWVCFGGLTLPLFSSTGWVFTTQDRTSEQMRCSIYTALISIASFAIGVHWGAVGVAAASALSFNFIQTPLMLLAMTRAGSIRRSDIARSLVPFLGATLVVATVLFLSRRVTHPAELVALAIMSYLLFGCCVGLTPSGREFLKTLTKLPALIRK